MVAVGRGCRCSGGGGGTKEKEQEVKKERGVRSGVVGCGSCCFRGGGAGNNLNPQMKLGWSSSWAVTLTPR